jgi:NitT/TauT family transport system permease protein
MMTWKRTLSPIHASGPGYVIVASGQNATTSPAFAPITLLAILSIVLFYLLMALERLIIPWATRRG